MKLAYDIKNGEIGIFGEELETENYVVIDENIKDFILMKYVRLDLSKVSNGKAVTQSDFIEMIAKSQPPSMEERIKALEMALLEVL